jgi:hypothetical protein
MLKRDSAKKYGWELAEMDQETRRNRLLADRAALENLQTGSTILQFEASGEPPDRYVINFRGKGLAKDSDQQAQVRVAETHQIEIRLPYSYPESPPDIRWVTPILHPNVSFSGFVNISDLGLPWSKQMSLDVICERLWDVARGMFFNSEQAVNYGAKNYFERECAHELPLDRRPLRDRLTTTGVNVVSYQRRAGAGIQFPAARNSGEIVFIDENTPLPPPPPRKRRGTEDDVLYIGPE